MIESYLVYQEQTYWPLNSLPKQQFIVATFFVSQQPVILGA